MEINEVIAPAATLIRTIQDTDAVGAYDELRKRGYSCVQIADAVNNVRPIGTPHLTAFVR
jgi:hypothetical protein